VVGENFLEGCRVEFAGSTMPDVTWEDEGKVSCRTSMHVAGPVEVKVINPDGQSHALPGGFTFINAPVIDGVNPPGGPATTGTLVHISGNHFLSGATVDFGGTLLSDLEVTGPTEIAGQTSEHRAGLVDVTVTNPDGQAVTLRRAFHFYGPPTASKVTPASGPAAGGTSVQIACEGIQPGVQVEFGGVPLRDVQPMGQFLITGRTVEHAAGPVEVVLINPDGQRGTLANGYTFEGAPAPVVTKVSPTTGPAAGGTMVQISCELFQPGVQVELGGSPLTDVTSMGKFMLQGRTTAHTSGPVDVVLINPDGQRGTLAKGFSYDAAPAPVISRVSPDRGPAAGGTPVQISCENFQPGTRVEFGGAPLLDVAPMGKFMLTGRTSPHAAGATDVVLINPDGQTVKLAGGFTYQ
jgi:hypothetical protein